jgi:2',3'-cyclic-nucleotide 2'-phosphodiesterase (5'-nucleotidase family)
LAVEADGGVRSDIPKGAVILLHVYETFPWVDDTYVRITMTGQDIINFLKATNLNAGFSREPEVSANDGTVTGILLNGQPINPSVSHAVFSQFIGRCQFLLPLLQRKTTWTA